MAASSRLINIKNSVNMTPTANLSSWKKFSEKTLNDYGFCQITQRTFQHPVSHENGDFIVINCNDSVQMIAETSDQKIVLVRQFRFGSENFSLELPAGRLEKEESPITGAVRELQEETGYIGENPVVLASLYVNPALMKNKIYIVKIENCQKLYPTRFDRFEDIETKIVSKQDIRKLIDDKQITNCITLSALAYYGM